MRTRCPHITLCSFFVPHLWLKVNLVVCPKIVASFHLSRAMSLAPHRTPSSASFLFPLFQVSKGCSHPEIPAQIHASAGVTDFLIQNLSHESSREDARVPWRKDAIRKQDLVERCDDLQKQRRTAESEGRKHGGTRLQRLFLWK